MRAANRSERTIESYLLALGQLIDHIGDQQVTAVTSDDLRGYLAEVLATRASATARQRHASLKQFFKWCLEEAEIASDPMDRVKAPKVVEQPVPVLTPEQLRALLKTAEGTGFTERRDTAIIAVLIDTGLRLGEMTGILLRDIDWTHDGITVTGKGGKTRTVGFGRETARDLDRYDRARRRHPQAHRPELWLGRKGPLSGSGIHQALNRRAEAAGIGHVHPHMFRHSYAHYFLEAGGTEGDLMEIAGWSSRQMLSRYGRSAAAARAREAQRRLSPRDRLGSTP